MKFDEQNMAIIDSDGRSWSYATPHTAWHAFLEGWTAATEDGCSPDLVRPVDREPLPSEKG